VVASSVAYMNLHSRYYFWSVCWTWVLSSKK